MVVAVGPSPVVTLPIVAKVSLVNDVMELAFGSVCYLVKRHHLRGSLLTYASFIHRSVCELGSISSQPGFAPQSMVVATHSKEY